MVKHFPDAGSFALIGLVIQNTAVAILLNLSFRPEATPYGKTTVVFVAEGTKLCICSLYIAFRSKRELVNSLVSIKKQGTLLVPSLLYVLQNNLLLYGAERLPPVIYIVCTQTKILSTALLSRIFLGTRLTRIQQASLFVLALGVVLVQQAGITEKYPRAGESRQIAEKMLGIFALLTASLTSGAAGVALEKIYKHQSTVGDETMVHSIWTRNIQLSLISLPFAFVAILVRDRDFILEGRFFDGYDSIVWGIVAFQTAGGIIIAIVMKYANNILKCLAVAVSICCCAMYSALSKEIVLSSTLLLGILTVIFAVISYSIGPLYAASRLPSELRNGINQEKGDFV
jgi:UDP-sugar transporter A1/2/3